MTKKKSKKHVSKYLEVKITIAILALITIAIIIVACNMNVQMDSSKDSETNKVALVTKVDTSTLSSQDPNSAITQNTIGEDIMPSDEGDSLHTEQEPEQPDTSEIETKPTIEETQAEEQTQRPNETEEIVENYTDPTLPQSPSIEMDLPKDKPQFSDYSDYAAFDQARDMYYTDLYNKAQEEGRHVVYLTFDDGCNDPNTRNVLKILDKYGVNATFFVVGNYCSKELAQELYPEIMRRGNSLGFHTYTHDRSKIYTSLEAFRNDVYKMYEYIYEITGFAPYLFRFPGGSSTSFSNEEQMRNNFIPYLKSLGIVHYDWNVVNGDGEGVTDKKELYQNVINGVSKHTNSVVLMHDGMNHQATVDTLDVILDTLINDMNCVILPITRSTIPISTY